MPRWLVFPKPVVVAGNVSSVVQRRIPGSGEVRLTCLVNDGAYFICNPCCAVPARKPVFSPSQRLLRKEARPFSRRSVGAQLLRPPGLRLFVSSSCVDGAMGSAGDRDFSLNIWQRCHKAAPRRDSPLRQQNAQIIVAAQYMLGHNGPPLGPEFIKTQICGVKSMFQSMFRSLFQS